MATGYIFTSPLHADTGDSTCHQSSIQVAFCDVLFLISAQVVTESIGLVNGSRHDRKQQVSADEITRWSAELPYQPHDPVPGTDADLFLHALLGEHEYVL